MRLELIKPTSKPDSLLSLVQEEERAENTTSDVKKASKEITREEDANSGYYNTAEDKDPDDPFISDHPFGQKDKEYA